MKIIAVLCLLSNPNTCHDQTVTTDGLTLFDCGNQAALADWMKSFPQYRLAGWKCQLGSQQGEKA